MTIASTNFRTAWLAANGTNKNWPYAFAVQSADQIVVQVKTAAGVVTEHTSNFTLIRSGPASGTVVYPVSGAALAAGYTVRIERRVPLTQPAAIGNQGKFYPQTHEDAFDRGVMQTQQVKDFADTIYAYAQELDADIEGLRGLLGGIELTANTYATRVGAAAMNHAAPVGYIYVQGYAAAGDGGASLWQREVAEPAHLGKFQSADGDWWSNIERVLRPEMFGVIGTSAALDTTAWTALISLANARGLPAEVDLAGTQYLFNGTGTVDDSQTFKNLPSVHIRMRPETKVRQRVALAKTFKFLNVTDAKVTGGHLYGYAQVQIDAAAALTELDLNASAGNAVAAVYAEADGLGKRLTVEGVKTNNHFGRDIHAYGPQFVTVRNCDLSGVGPTYNNPIAHGHQGNGEDAAIYVVPKDYSAAGTAWLQELVVERNRIEWHSFGIRTILNGRLRVANNHFGETPGQYHIYDTDSDGVSTVDNYFYKSRMISIKHQFENLAGFIYGPAYNPNGNYSPGDVVRASSILWVNRVGYSPGGAAFSSANWDSHPRNYRAAGLYQGNTFEDCGAGMGWVVAGGITTDGRLTWSTGISVIGNQFIRSAEGEAIRLERALYAQIAGNTIIDYRYGVHGRYFSGTISDNEFRRMDNNAILVSLAYDAVFDGNRIWDAGINGTADDNRAPIHVYELDATDPPAWAATPSLHLRNNGILYTGGLSESPTPTDAPGAHLIFVSDARLKTHISGTYGSPTTKNVRVAGTVDYKFNNHFPSYYNIAQNEPTYTVTNALTQRTFDANGVLADTQDVLATLLADLDAKKLIKRV